MSSDATLERVLDWLHRSLVRLAWWLLVRLEPDFPSCRCPACQGDVYDGLKLVPDLPTERADEVLHFCVNCHVPLPAAAIRTHDGRWLCKPCKVPS